MSISPSFSVHRVDSPRAARRWIAATALAVISCRDIAPNPSRPSTTSECECDCTTSSSSAPPASGETLWEAEIDTRLGAPKCSPDRWRATPVYAEWIRATTGNWGYHRPDRVVGTVFGAPLHDADIDKLRGDLGASGVERGHLDPPNYIFSFHDERTAIRAFKALLCDARVTYASVSNVHEYPPLTAVLHEDAPPCSPARWIGTAMQTEWEMVTLRHWQGTPNGRMIAGILRGQAPTRVAEAIGAAGLRGPLFHSNVYEFAFNSLEAAIHGFKLLLCDESVTYAVMELER